MWERIKDWGAAFAIAILVAALVWAFDRDPAVPDQAPDFTLAGLDGESVRLADLRGRTVVVNFWASWCGPCRDEIPEFSRFAKDHPEIALLGLAVDSGDAPEVRRSASRLGIDYPVALADNATLQAYDVDVFPTTVVVGPDGMVRHVQVGAMSYEQLASAVSRP